MPSPPSRRLPLVQRPLLAAVTIFVLFAAPLLFALGSLAQPAQAAADDRASAAEKAAILRVLDDQQAAWNRGDVETFMHGYQDSPETTFIGSTVRKGYQPILERYKSTYNSPAAMGHLDFSEQSIRMLGPDHAVVTGRFHLTRTAAGGGDARGIFSLIFEKEPKGWKIILDHTSTTP